MVVVLPVTEMTGGVRRGDSGVVVVQVHVTVSLVVMVIVLVALLVMSLVGERGEC